MAWDLIFLFQAEDGIRDYKVTGVQTCALPIYRTPRSASRRASRQLYAKVPGFRASSPYSSKVFAGSFERSVNSEIGRASCRERVEIEKVVRVWTRRDKRAVLEKG